MRRQLIPILFGGRSALRIELVGGAGTTIPEDTPISTALGQLVLPDGYVLTDLIDPDDKFAVVEDPVSIYTLYTDDTFDYETATSHQVTAQGEHIISGAPIETTFTITVTNVADDESLPHFAILFR